MEMGREGLDDTNDLEDTDDRRENAAGEREEIAKGTLPRAVKSPQFGKKKSRGVPPHFQTSFSWHAVCCTQHCFG
jgi:hypothetical protein